MGHRVAVIDPREPDVKGVEWHCGDAKTADLIAAQVSEADIVAFLATGANQGWAGIQATEIEGLVAVLESCLGSKTVRRLIFASSNHAAGGYELDRLDYRISHSISPISPNRPDGLYGAAKCFGEALCRTVGELYNFPTSVLRIGTMRLNDDPLAHTDDPDFAKYGGPQVREQRLLGSWLYHKDLVEIYRREVMSRQTFRLCFASSNAGSIWSDEVMTWSPSAEGGTHD